MIALKPVGKAQYAVIRKYRCKSVRQYSEQGTEAQNPRYSHRESVLSTRMGKGSKCVLVSALLVLLNPRVEAATRFVSSTPSDQYSFVFPCKKRRTYRPTATHSTGHSSPATLLQHRCVCNHPSFPPPLSLSPVPTNSPPQKATPLPSITAPFPPFHPPAPGSPPSSCLSFTIPINPSLTYSSHPPPTQHHNRRDAKLRPSGLLGPADYTTEGRGQRCWLQQWGLDLELAVGG